MKKGRFGVPRPLGIGPVRPGIIFGQPESEDEMEEELFDVIDEEMGGDVDLDTDDPEVISDIQEALIERTFPDSERKRNRLESCIDDWGSDWADGALNQTGSGDATPIELLVKATNGCRGMVESNTIERPTTDEE